MVKPNNDGSLEQTITLDNQRLEDIAIILKRWYNVEIHFQSDKNKDKRFSGEFNDLPLKKVMEILKLSNPFQSTFRDNRIIID